MQQVQKEVADINNKKKQNKTGDSDKNNNFVDSSYGLLPANSNTTVDDNNKLNKEADFRPTEVQHLDLASFAFNANEIQDTSLE